MRYLFCARNGKISCSYCTQHCSKGPSNWTVERPEAKYTRLLFDKKRAGYMLLTRKLRFIWSIEQVKISTESISHLWSSLKVQQHEIVDRWFFSIIDPIWAPDSRIRFRIRGNIRIWMFISAVGYSTDSNFIYRQVRIFIFYFFDLGVL